jgi:hypothetical protein
MKIALAVALALAAGAAGGWWYEHREVAALTHRAELAERERDEARAKPAGSGLMAIANALGQARAQAASTPPKAPKPGESPAADAKEPRDTKAAIPDVAAELSGMGEKARSDAVGKLNLSPDQEQALKKITDEMNQGLNSSLAKVIEMIQQSSKSSHPTSGKWVAAAAALLAPIKKADDDFQAQLSPQQRDLLGHGDFDVVTQIDPMIFVPILLSMPDDEHHSVKVDLNK